jgi:hypothetical protein
MPGSDFDPRYEDGPREEESIPREAQDSTGWPREEKASLKDEDGHPDSPGWPREEK